MSSHHWYRPHLLLGIVSALGLLVAAACGGGTTEPTATATATTTGPAPTATATSSDGVVTTPEGTAASTPTPKPSVTPKKGGVIRQSHTEEVPNWDPHLLTTSTLVAQSNKLYSQLIWNPDGQELVEDAVESYSISADGKVWTFKLRPNIKFQTGYVPSHPRDGTTMTSADVKWSLEKIMGFHGQTISARSGWMKEFIDIDRADMGIEIVDELTFKVHMIQPFASFPNVLAIGTSGIVPEGLKTTDLLTRPFGSGPFRLGVYQVGSLLRYDRNPDYFKPGLPYIDVWNRMFMSGDAVVQAAFATNKLDTGTGNPLPDNQALWDRMMAEGKIKTRGSDSYCGTQGVFMNMTKPPFNDKKLREIVNLGLDRVGYAVVVHEGLDVPPTRILIPAWSRPQEYIQNLPGWRQPHAPDLAEAQRQLKELYPSGVNLTLMSRNSTSYMRLNEYVAGNLTNIGFKVTMQPFDTTTIFEKAANLDYTIWGYYFCQTSMTLEELFSYYITGGSRNWFGISDPKIDAGYLDLAATSDPVLRKQKAWAMEDILMDYGFFAPTGVHVARNADWSYVMDYPTGITMYTSQKHELVWRSDV